MKPEVTINLALQYDYRPMELRRLCVEGLNLDGSDPGKPRDISEFLLRTAVIAKYGGAMPRADSRLWAAILKKLKARTDTIMISADQFRWLFDVVDKYDFAAALSD